MIDIQSDIEPSVCPWKAFSLKGKTEEVVMKVGAPGQDRSSLGDRRVLSS